MPTNIAVNYVQHNRCESYIYCSLTTGSVRWDFSNSANIFSQSITRTWTHHRGTTGTEKSPKQGHCVWVTQRNRVLRVSESSASVALMALKLGVYKSIQFLTLRGYSALHSTISTQSSQATKQWKSHRWLPLWEVQEDESKILKSSFCFLKMTLNSAYCFVKKL